MVADRYHLLHIEGLQPSSPRLLPILSLRRNENAVGKQVSTPPPFFAGARVHVLAPAVDLLPSGDCFDCVSRQYIPRTANARRPLTRCVRLVLPAPEVLLRCVRPPIHLRLLALAFRHPIASVRVRRFNVACAVVVAKSSVSVCRVKREGVHSRAMVAVAKQESSAPHFAKSPQIDHNRSRCNQACFQSQSETPKTGYSIRLFLLALMSLFTLRISGTLVFRPGGLRGG